MSIVQLGHVCSHLQNASRARLGLTSITMTKMHLALVLAMQRHGLFSTVQVGGRRPPLTQMELDAGISLDLRDSLEKRIEEEPWLGLSYGMNAQKVRSAAPSSPIQDQQSFTKLNLVSPVDPGFHPEVPANPAHRRIWLGLKYWSDQPVLRNVNLLSKPKRRLTATVTELKKLAAGQQQGYVAGMMNPGECMFLSTEIGILEVREALKRTTGGLLLVRTS